MIDIKNACFSIKLNKLASSYMYNMHYAYNIDDFCVHCNFGLFWNLEIKTKLKWMLFNCLMQKIMNGNCKTLLFFKSYKSI